MNLLTLTHHHTVNYYVLLLLFTPAEGSRSCSCWHWKGFKTAFWWPPHRAVQSVSHQFPWCFFFYLGLVVILPRLYPFLLGLLAGEGVYTRLLTNPLHCVHVVCCVYKVLAVAKLVPVCVRVDFDLCILPWHSIKRWLAPLHLCSSEDEFKMWFWAVWLVILLMLTTSYPW